MSRKKREREREREREKSYTHASNPHPDWRAEEGLIREWSRMLEGERSLVTVEMVERFRVLGV